MKTLTITIRELTAMGGPSRFERLLFRDKWVEHRIKKKLKAAGFSLRWGALERTEDAQGNITFTQSPRIDKR